MQVVSNEVDRKLHYVHIIEIYKDGIVKMIIDNLKDKLVEIFKDLVKSYVLFLREKMITSSDDVLKFVINFSFMTVKYNTLQNVVHEGDSVTVEAIYSYFTPI